LAFNFYLRHYVKDAVLEPGFFGPGLEAPVFKVAKATERYSGSDLKELCKAAAYGPIRDLLDQEYEERERVEKQQRAKSGGGGGSVAWKLLLATS